MYLAKKATILKSLQNLEAEHDIRVLLAVESGSRAWGFASPDSDWDVRFIYVHKPEWYLSIDQYKDSLEVMLPGDLDLAGWELQKALRLFRKSNPALLEWLGGPMVYLEKGNTARRLRDLIPSYFNPVGVTYHYLHLARGTFREFVTQDVVRWKKYFYVLRPLLACRWMERKGGMAAVEFSRLLEAAELPGEIRGEIDRLLEMKTSAGEMESGAPIMKLNAFLETEIAYFEEKVKNYPARIPGASEPLNKLFRASLKEEWGAI